MIVVTINGKKYKLKTEWDDITLSEFQKVCSLTIPEKLKEQYLALLKEEEFDYTETHADVIKIFPAFYGRVIALLSDIPQSVINVLDWQLRTKLYNEYLLHFVETTLAPMPLEIIDGKLHYYKGYGASKVRWNGEVFYFPESLFYGGQRQPLAKEKIITFSEASDVSIAINEWGEKGIGAMAQVCAVYLRKEKEEHSDELVMQRTEQFKELPMSIVWEVFFCIMRLGNSLAEDILSSSKAARARIKKQLEGQAFLTTG